MPHARMISRDKGLAIAELSGSPYEMGLAHGRLFGPEIALMRARLVAYLSDISFGVGGRTLLWLFGQQAGRMERYIPVPLVQEMHGIADGSRQPYGFIRLMNALDDVLVNMACSAVAVGPEASADGRLIVGRNLDYPLFYDLLPRLNTVFRYRPDTGRGFVSVGWPGFAAVVTGMNDAGLFISDLTSFTRDRRLDGMPALLLNRTALQSASSLEEVERVYTDARRTVGKNILAASPDGAMVMEFSAGKLMTRRMTDGVLVATNHFESPEMVSRQGSVKPPPKTDFPARYYSYEYSRERMDCMYGAFAGKTGARVNDVERALGREPVANGSTVQSVVFVPQTRRLLVAKRRATPVSAGEYMELPGLL